MAQSTQSILDMFTKLGQDLKVPSVDMEKFIAHHRKNLEAIGGAGKVAAEGAMTVAGKQRELVEAALKEMSEMAKGFKMPGSPQEAMAAQAEFAKRAMEAAVKNTKDVAELIQKHNTDAMKIMQDRMKESMEEIRSAFVKK